MRLGVLILPEHSLPAAEKIWCRAEELGLDHAWTYDHIAWRTLRDARWFGAVPTLTAAATVTRALRLGTLVASPNFRHPVPFARELITLDHFSSGRLTVGIGAGGVGWDATVLGQRPWPIRERMERFAEFVELTDHLLRQSRTTYEGRYYSADEAPMAPGCVQQPRLPLAIAASGSNGMAAVARFGQVWVTTGDRSHDGPPMDAASGAAVVRKQAKRLGDACARVRRDPGDLDVLVLLGLTLDSGLGSVEQFRDTIGRYEEAGVTDLVVHWPRTEPPFAGDPVRFEEVITEVTG
jgi:alkanesulfonate monooxygenase SsuD/methylene tetrahydromethanopterin reductase-like flavin-dependent oxidoreductase (luciferase family)